MCIHRLGIENEPSLFIKRKAAFQTFADKGFQRLAGAVLENRAGLSRHLEAGGKLVDADPKVNRLPAGVHKRHVIEETGRAAAGGDDDVFELGYLVQHPAFEFAESLLAPLGEDLTDSFVESLLDEDIQVDEGKSQEVGQVAKSRPRVVFPAPM